MGGRGDAAFAERASRGHARRRPHDQLRGAGGVRARDPAVSGGAMRFVAGNGAKVPEKRSAIADFDSAAAMLRALAGYLHGTDFPLLGVFPTSKEPLWRAIGA